MNYSDFPILNFEEYDKLSNKYIEHNNKITHKNYISDIFNLLSECINSLTISNNNFNTKIKSSLKNSLTIIEQALDNINAIFKTKKTQGKIVTEFNIFNYLKKLILIINLSNDWLAKETKLHYKQFAINLNKSINYALENILTNLEKSNITFYKFM